MFIRDVVVYSINNDADEYKTNKTNKQNNKTIKQQNKFLPRVICLHYVWQPSVMGNVPLGCLKVGLLLLCKTSGGGELVDSTSLKISETNSA